MTSREVRARLVVRLLAFSLTVLAVATPVSASFAGVAGALPGPTRSGDVQIVDGTDPSKPLLEGGSTEVYTLELPSGASCPGDSANDDYRYQGYLVAEDVDPPTIKYTSIGPAEVNQTAIFRSDTDSLTDELTIANDVPGKPGVLPPIPPLSFNSYVPGFVAPGTYRLGIACTYLGTTTNYWDTTVRIEDDPTDEPANVHWVALSAPPASTSSSGPSIGVAAWVVAAGVVALVGAFLFAKLRKPSLSGTD